MAQISYGSITIVDTTDIQRFYVQYAQNNSSAVAPTTGWRQERPTWVNGSYIWQRTVTKKQGVALTSLDYGNPVCITGAKGDPGQIGNTGKGISSIVTLYCNYGTGTPTESYSGWSSNVPEYDNDKPNYWVKTTINYTSGNPDVTIYKDLGITEAVEKANLANTTAQTAESHSIEAISIADSKNRIYYSSTFPTQGNYIDGDTLFKESSNGTVLYIYDKTYNDSVSGHWKQQQFEENAIANLAITNAKIKNLHGDKITANTIAASKLVAHTITTNQLATDAIKSSNYAAGTAPYSLTGTFLDLSNGNIFTPNFGVNNDSTDNINNGAYIKGTIQAYDGKIGSNNNNYWYIGNYFDYNQGQSAMIRSHGTAAIQLGDSGTWRLSTNRIHTAWNDDSTSGEAFRLHYPIYGGKYWDSGLHVPASATDKLLYIRNAATTVSLENLQNDINDNSGGNYWNYQFYLTNDGSLYAKNIYIMDDSGNTTQIGGTDGVYLLKSGGIISGNLEITGTLKTQGNFLNRSGSVITLQTNLASTSAATLTGNSTSPINLGVTGTLPVANGGTGNTNYTSGGIVYVSNTNPKTLLSNAAGTSGQLLASGGSGVPTWVNASSLTVAAATKATQDGNGKVIATTYLPLTGGNITGSVSFGDSVSIDDLTAGALIVTGNSSFTNNIQANTINGVAVGSSPKFTDTVTTVTTSGNGNAVTAITASGGQLTVTKGTTFLTSYTQTDPVFKASAAASIKQTDIDNWNSKTSNTGTVTSVAASGSGGITISGSPITTSGTITIGLNLSTAINGLGEGSSPATRGDYIVAQYAGGGTTTTTYHRRKLSNIFAALSADDIPGLAWSKITSGNDDLKAIEALTGTSGFLKKTAANTWTLDTNTYVTSSGITSIKIDATGPVVSSTSTNQTAAAASTTISLADAYGDTKNPYGSKTARYVLAAPAAQAGVPTFRALTNADVGLSNVLNVKQVTGIGQGANGKIRVYKGTGTNDYEDVSVEIVATSTSSVASSQKLTSYGGSATQPVYFPADGANAGKPVAISYTIEKSVPSNAVFTDTWHKVSTAQDGYVTKLPGNTTSFLRGDGSWATPAGTYSLPLAASGTRGGIQIGYSTSGKNYAVQLSGQKAYVNVPWTDTTYSAGTGLSLSGTTFNHSNSVTAGTAGTSSATSGATLAVPYITYDAQGHITGSGTHTHTINNIPQADVTWGGPALTGTVSPDEVATIDDMAHNKFAFMSAASIAVHYSRDNGSTWTAYGSDAEHRKLVTLESWFQIGGPDAGKAATVKDQLRIQLNANIAGGNIYCSLRRILIYLTVEGSGGCTCTLQYKTIANYNNNTDTWTTAGTYNVSGWSGWNSIPFNGNFGGSSTQTGQIAQIRLIFKVTSVSTTHSNLAIRAIRGIAFPLWQSPSTMASIGHLYYFDIDQNATFPAQITATQFNGSLNGNAATASALSNKTLDSTTINNTAGSFAFKGSGAPWDGTDWVGLQVDSGVDKFQLHPYSTTTLEYRQNDTGGENGTDWGAWQTLLSSGNYTDYTVTKTGSGANGTWGISISGNAATASSVAWNNITDKPINLKAYSGSLASGGWAQLNGKANSPSIAIAYNSNPAAWNSYPYSSSMVFGCSDTRGLLDIAYNTPTITFGGTSFGNATDDNPKWYFKINGTSGQSYTFPSTSKTLAATDGTGASGTWGISISGTAAKATADKNGNDITTKYVTVDTTQDNISGRKTFSDLAAVTFKPSSGTDKCNINYDASLGALVFSF